VPPLTGLSASQLEHEGLRRIAELERDGTEVGRREKQLAMRTVWRDVGAIREDWVRIEFILYNKHGVPVGTTSDCKIGFPSGESWKFQAPVNQLEAVHCSEGLLSCEYGRVTRIKHASLPQNSLQPSSPMVASKNGQDS